MVAGTAAGSAALMAAQLAWVVTRPLPSYTDMDASGVEGPTQLPLVRLAVLGDSTCTGPGLADPADIWVRGFARSLTNTAHVDVRSVAVGGARAVDVVRDQLERAVQLQPDIALVSVGGNDALRGVRPGTFRRHLEEIVVSLNASARIVGLSGVGDLGSLPRVPRPLSDVARARSRIFNQIHIDVAHEHGVVVADQWKWSVKEFNSRPELFAADQFHASAAGHAIWAEVAHEALGPHLAEVLTV